MSMSMDANDRNRFPTISDRFVTEIRNIQGTDKAAEGKLELMIKSMHYLKLKVYIVSTDLILLIDLSNECIGRISGFFTSYF